VKEEEGGEIEGSRATKERIKYYGKKRAKLETNPSITLVNCAGEAVPGSLQMAI